MKFEIKNIIKTSKGLSLEIVGTLKSGRKIRYLLDCEVGQEQKVLADFVADTKSAVDKYNAYQEQA